jgi:hypothetical protein
MSNRQTLHNTSVNNSEDGFRKFDDISLISDIRHISILGTFPILGNFPSHAIISFYARSQICQNRLSASSCRSVRMEQLGLQRTEFNGILCLCIFRKSVEDPKVSLKLHNNDGTVLSVKRNIQLWSYLAQFFVELGMFQTEIVEEIKTLILFWTNFPTKPFGAS